MAVVNFLKKQKTLMLLIIDMLLIVFSYFIASYLVLDNTILFSRVVMRQVAISAMLSIIIYEIFLHMFKVYQNIIKYESGKDYFVYVLICMVSATTISLFKVIFNLPMVSTKIMYLAMILISGSLIGYRVILRYCMTESLVKLTEGSNQKAPRNLLIIGGGSATRDIIKVIDSSMRKQYHIVGIIDDNPAKINGMIGRVRILGTRENIVSIAKSYQVTDIFFCISHVSGKDKKDILDICQKTGAKIRVLPTMENLILNKNILQNLREIKIEDVLGREPVYLDNRGIEQYIKGNTILVTGAGGSIGSELCRQIASYQPKKLVMLDIYENNLYDIELELKAKYGNSKVEIEAIIGSVRDKKRVAHIFKTYRPSLVFHAAAHKHVPLMEHSPLEAIKNNVLGTYNVVNAADKYQVKRFILISTDKAVNPTNIMGASKRICEMIVQAKAKTSHTEFAAVRFRKCTRKQWICCSTI